MKVSRTKRVHMFTRKRWPGGQSSATIEYPTWRDEPDVALSGPASHSVLLEWCGAIVASHLQEHGDMQLAAAVTRACALPMAAEQE